MLSLPKKSPPRITQYLSIPALLWLLGACVMSQTPTAEPNSTSSNPPAAQSPAQAAPEQTAPEQTVPNQLSKNQSSPTQCQGEIPAALQATFGEFRLAQPTDFVPKIQQLQAETLNNQAAQTPTIASDRTTPAIDYTCSNFVADFNQDQQLDYAVLLVNPQSQTTQFRLALHQTDGTFNSIVTRDYPNPPAAITQPLYVSMFLKPAGEAGPANRDYFPLKLGTPERDTFIASTAIELWLPPTIYQTGISSDLSAEERFNQPIGYGSEVFYLIDNQLTTVNVAD
jgi:hypothetical protein